ncbi:MAG: hypothetical protein IJH79_14095, partial [Lentisphaeria bacterium]|nr:hypothetical protein [Lentisphaeria bacterium]
WAYEPLYAAYARQPSGLPFPHMLPDPDGRGAFFAGNAPSPQAAAELIQLKIEDCVAALQSGRRLDFYRHAGALGHFLQDMTAPTHVIEPRLLRNLFPDPETERCAGLTGCYSIADDLETARPRLAGRTAGEAAFQLMNDAFFAADRAQRSIPELMRAVYARDENLCREILRGPASDAAALSARAWHTVFCLAFERFPESELAELSPFRLDRVFPAYRHPGLYAFAEPGGFCLDGRREPLRLLTGGGARTFDSGFGMTGYSGMKFYLHGQFSALEFTLGLADHESSFLPHAELDFTVEVSNGWNRTCSEDMLFGGRVVRKIRLGPGAPAQSVKVEIDGAGTLILAAKTIPWQTAEGETRFDIPHLAVADPVLFR